MRPGPAGVKPAGPLAPSAGIRVKRSPRSLRHQRRSRGEVPPDRVRTPRKDWTPRGTEGRGAPFQHTNDPARSDTCWAAKIRFARTTMTRVLWLKIGAVAALWTIIGAAAVSGWMIGRSEAAR